MQLSERFLALVDDQLSSFESEAAIENLVVYVAKSSTGDSPSFEVVGQWPNSGKTLPPVESDPELRMPSPYRRWYPLQEGSILLGVIRVERSSSGKDWPKQLDQRLRAVAAALAHSLGLELDRKRLFEELSQQRDQIGLMVHQLRNPLAALRTYAQLLLRKLGPESNHRSLVEGLLTEQDQLNRYVSALDQLSQVKLTPQSSNQNPLLLPPILNNPSSSNLRSLLEPLIERAKATARLQGRKWFNPSSWPHWAEKPISSEETVIAEIVANLLENAFRYSPSASSIGLFLNDDGICVWDEGIPIKEEEREKIFQKGFRGEKGSEFSGSGLGLAYGRQVAEELGGKLELIIKPALLDSTLPKEGNAFVFILQAK